MRQFLVIFFTLILWWYFPQEFVFKRYYISTWQSVCEPERTEEAVSE